MVEESKEVTVPFLYRGEVKVEAEDDGSFYDFTLILPETKKTVVVTVEHFQTHGLIRVEIDG